MAGGQPRVSVIVPTRNRSALLREALASVDRLRGVDLEIELIVVDNNSTDDTVLVAQQFGAKVVAAERIGAGAARNAGLAAATGDFLAFLDDDDVFLPGHLRPHISYMAEHLDIDAVVGQAVNTDVTGQQHGDAFPQDLPRHGDLFASFLEYCPQLGATVVRNCVRTAVPWFDETLIDPATNLFSTDEDWDWHLRVALHHRVGFVPVPCVLFRHRPLGSDFDLLWRRLPFTKLVYRNNLRRAGHRRPSSAIVARTVFRQHGWYCIQLLDAARCVAAAGDYRHARKARLRAFLVSPPHAVKGLLFRRKLTDVTSSH